MSRSHPQFHLRIPPDLDEQVRRSANQQQISVNAEMIRRIRLSFELENLLEKSPSEFAVINDKLDRILNIINAPVDGD